MVVLIFNLTKGVIELVSLLIGKGFFQVAGGLQTSTQAQTRFVSVSFVLKNNTLQHIV